jgi:hypothetical protein
VLKIHSMRGKPCIALDDQTLERLNIIGQWIERERHE